MPANQTTTIEFPAQLGAVRRWNKARTKATVEVTANGQLLQKLGGARAHRANSVIIYWRSDGQTYFIGGLRADPVAAQREAERTGRYGSIAWAGSVLVQEEDA